MVVAIQILAIGEDEVKNGRAWNANATLAHQQSRGRTEIHYLLLVLLCLLAGSGLAWAGEDGAVHYRIGKPILRQNLTLYPVLADRSWDAASFMTLDEGVRSGQVVVTEAGQEVNMVHPGQHFPVHHTGAEVNRLVLYNNSSRPLLLLAGEIVTGGKQDRILGADRIVPPGTGPIDLGVFCVEPGRWVESSHQFGSMGAQMAQPSVRTPAMAQHNQDQVWENVRESRAKIAGGLLASDAVSLNESSSYAKTFASAPVAKMISSYGGSAGEESIQQELHAMNAVGVVVAVNGHILWADIFAGNDLFSRYWPKLMHSYVAEAMTDGGSTQNPSVDEAQRFVNQLSGGREVSETEPGIYRRTEFSSQEYRVFELSSLLPKAAFPVHITKIASAELHEAGFARHPNQGRVW